MSLRSASSLPVVLVLALARAPSTAEGSPRNIAAARPGRPQRQLRPAAGAAVGSGRIYLLSPEVIGQPRTLQSVARDVGDTPADAMKASSRARTPTSSKRRCVRRSHAARACSTSGRWLAAGGRRVERTATAHRRGADRRHRPDRADGIGDHQRLVGGDLDQRHPSAMAGGQWRAAERAVDALRLPRARVVVAARVSFGAFARTCRVASALVYDSRSLPSRRAAMVMPTPAMPHRTTTWPTLDHVNTPAFAALTSATP